MTDIVTYCDVNTCEDCPRYGADCDGDKRVEHTDYISRADAIAYIDRVIKSGLGRQKSLNYIRKYISALPSADAEQIVYCMDCAKSVPLDEHGALWKCKAHDRTTLRHSYCNNGERKGGDTE